MGQDTALAIEDIAGITLAALYAVVITLALQADGSTAGLADTHAALIVAVGGAGDRWNRRDHSSHKEPQMAFAQSHSLARSLASSGRWKARAEGRGVRLATFPRPCSLFMNSLCLIPYWLNGRLVCAEERGWSLPPCHCENPLATSLGLDKVSTPAQPLGLHLYQYSSSHPVYPSSPFFPSHLENLEIVSSPYYQTPLTLPSEPP